MATTKLNFYLLFFTFIIAPYFVSAQSVYNIQGTVADSASKNIIAYATIAIAPKANPTSFLKKVTTNEKGVFKTTLPTHGEYILLAIFEGKNTKTLPFIIEENKKETNLGFIYMGELGETLANVVVRSQKPIVKMEIDKLTYDVQNDPDARSESVLEMLRKVPMITVDGEDNIQLKGSSSYKVYINGKPSSMVASNPSQVLKSMPASNIKDIEVITDPGAKYDAEGLAGIINIITAKNTIDGYTGNVRVGVNTHKGYNGSAYVTIKYGKFSLSGNMGYTHWNTPDIKILVERNDYLTNTLLMQEGTENSKGPRQYGGGELTFELDTLNMFSVGFNHFFGKGTSDLYFNTSLMKDGNNLYSYLRQTSSMSKYGGTDISANYQRSFKKKGMLLTSSYRYGYSPNDSENGTEVLDVVNFNPLKEDSWSNAYSKEHSGQVDFVAPIKDIHTIETGVKYIYRDNLSEVVFNEFDFTNQEWINNPNRENNLDYRQGIFSVYGSYGLKLKKMGVKVGLRAENTDIDANFTDNNNSDKSTLKSNKIDVVPTVNLSYMIGMTQTIQFGYNMRIRRPGISHLNPYLNDSDPLNTSSGNPELESEKSNNLSLSYSRFSQKFNLNASFNYSFVNNAIQDYTTIKDSVTHRTFANIGKNQNVGLNLFASWTPISDLRMYMNGGANYSKFDNDNSVTSGFGVRVFAGVNYTFLKSFRIGIQGGIFKQPDSYQSKMTAFKMYAITFGKDFFDKKLSFDLQFQTPFIEYNRFKRTTEGPNFNQKIDVKLKTNVIGFNISYKFGELKSQVNKIQRGINNDDLIQGQQQGGQQTGM